VRKNAFPYFKRDLLKREKKERTAIGKEKEGERKDANIGKRKNRPPKKENIFQEEEEEKERGNWGEKKGTKGSGI